MAATIDLSALHSGATLRSPVFDTYQTKLLAAGLTITDDILTALRKRGVSRVLVDDRDLARLQAFRPQGYAREAPMSHAAEHWPAPLGYPDQITSAQMIEIPTEIVASADPFAAQLKPRGAVKFDESLSNHVAEQSENWIDHLGATLLHCEKGEHSAAFELSQSVERTMALAIEDLDIFVCRGVNPFSADYPNRHSYHVAMLALGIGARLGLDMPDLHSLATGCMIHDLGMLTIDRRVLSVDRTLRVNELVAVARHPLKTFELLGEAADRMTMGTKMVVMQMHERCHSLGYPNRVPRDKIHFLARIAAVADTYTALVTPRPHRKAMLPYAAIEFMIQHVRQGEFDAEVVRALLGTIGLFPLGSFLAINDEYVGRAIRCSPDQFDRPIVELWKRGHLRDEPAIVDLRHEPELKVKKPLAALGI